jgi:hypothetical protein
MTAATQVITSFLGGEISQYAQGRYDRPDYRTSMRVCLNSFPIESGAWTRRPGTRFAQHTRGGKQGRKIKFDFEQSNSVTLEFTDGYLRARSGTSLLSTNDDVAVLAVSVANPAVMQVASAVTWVNGNCVMFPGASTPLLENRQFTVTKIDTTHFSLQDALTGANIDGSTLGALATGTTVMRVQELQTVYVGTRWSSIRAVQAETTNILLNAAFPPQALTVATLPSTGVDPVFAITAATFSDGPYLDPPVNGALVTPSALTGLVTLTLSFGAYVATQAYAKNTFVTSSGVDYISLVDQNVGNTPVSSPSAWAPTSASTAINDGRGFLGTDVGRLIRLLSEPPAFVATTTYSAGQVVSYNPTNQPGAATYWQALISTTTTPPGYDLSHWQQLVTGPAVWTWGRIISLPNIISRSLSGSVAVGDMTLFNGITAPFDGNFSKSIGSSAAKSVNTSGSFNAGNSVSIVGYVGKNFSGASPQQIQQATIYPSNDRGFGFGTYQDFFGNTQTFFPFYTLNLRAKQTTPSSSGDGTLLSSVSFSGSSTTQTLISSDQTTAWNFVWVEVVMSSSFVTPGTSYTLAIDIAQISFFSPTTSASGSAGCVVEILGPALSYNATIATWRLGAYSDTTGYPTCGCYDGGRLWLGGAIANRWDACYSNGISGSTINFAPTNQYGVVSASNAMSFTFNSDSVNPIFWMSPELQGILMGTQAGEWLVQAPTNGPIAPNNVSGRRVTKIGCANVEPCRTEHTTIFVKRYGRKLMEYFADVYSGKYSAPNLADKAQHLTSPGVAQLAYTEAVNPILWAMDDVGGLVGVTYKRDSLSSAQGPAFYGWHHHTLGSARSVESICAGPSTDGNLDTLTMVTNDSATAIRHVEVLTDTPDELTTFANCWFLDDAVNPTSVSTTVTPSGGAPFGGMTINGLWHLNGKTVQVFAGGLDCGDRGDLNVITDFTVSNGSVFVPFGDGISGGPGKGMFTQAFALALPLTQIVVGFTYNSDGQIVRLIAQADTGARNGPAMGAPSRTHRAALKLVNTTGLSFGGNFDRLYPCIFMMNGASATKLGTLSLFSGTFYDQVRDDFTYEDSLCWRVSRPYPATITAAGVNLRTEDM